MNIKEATEQWIQDMNCYPYSMICALSESPSGGEWQEVTKPAPYNQVYILSEQCYGEVVRYHKDTDMYEVKNEDEEIGLYKETDIELCTEGSLPGWGYMWSFKENLDEYWLEDEDGIRKMSECGFRVYHSDEWGYFFGIDGAGYDFYASHWIPLYKARGFHWHDEEKISA